MVNVHREADKMQHPSKVERDCNPALLYECDIKEERASLAAIEIESRLVATLCTRSMMQ